MGGGRKTPGVTWRWTETGETGGWERGWRESPGGRGQDLSQPGIWGQGEGAWAELGTGGTELTTDGL